MTGVIRRTVSSATASTGGFNHGGLSAGSSCPSGRTTVPSNKLSPGHHHASHHRLVSNNHLNTLNMFTAKDGHKKLDRSFSEPAEKKNPVATAAATASSTNLAPSSRYKTELCRSFAEIGTCKYGDKCQFAHGQDELRTITRHPKFKTENCKSFHSTGFCPYGPRCHFIHNDESKKIGSVNGSGSNQQRHFEVPLAIKTAAVGSTGFGLAEHHSLYPARLPFMTSSLAGVAVGNSPAAAAAAAAGASTVVRPKALSLSLGSSGEISLPSSQSGSPTSLNSFFTDDPHAATFGFGSSGLRLGSGTGNAFSFSPDSAFISFAHSNNPPHSAGLAFGSGNSTTTTTAAAAAAAAAKPCTNIFGVRNLALEESSLISSLFSRPSNEITFGESSSINDYLFRSMSPPCCNKSLLYPSSPDSPVDSVASEIEALKLGEVQPSTFSPISSSSLFSNSSLSISSGSSSAGLLEAFPSFSTTNMSGPSPPGLPDPFASFQSPNISRLPTFTKFAATAPTN